MSTSKEGALISFVGADPHEHVDENIVLLLWLGSSQGVDAELLIKAHKVVDDCGVCAAMKHEYHTRRNTVAA